MKIQFKAKSGTAEVEVDIYEMQQLTEEYELQVFHGLKIEDDFGEYTDLDFKYSGYCRFSLEKGILYVIIDVTTEKDLTEKEILAVRNEISGQLSDGIGESFEQHPATTLDDMDCYVSPWYPGQELDYKIID